MPVHYIPYKAKKCSIGHISNYISSWKMNHSIIHKVSIFKKVHIVLEHVFSFKCVCSITSCECCLLQAYWQDSPYTKCTLNIPTVNYHTETEDQPCVGNLSSTPMISTPTRFSKTGTKTVGCVIQAPAGDAQACTCSLY